MNSVFVIAKAEISTLFKEKVFFVLLAVFVLMTLVSSLIGWSTFTTTSAVYNSSVIFLHQHGVTQIPANPILAIPALASFRNVIVYMFLIGALMAIVIGHRSFIRERKSAVLPLVFSRPVSTPKLLLGKIGGIVFILFCIVGFTVLISVSSAFILPWQHLSASELGRLLIFYVCSFFYLLFFSLLGLFFAIFAKSESVALFIPVCIWVGISFVLPDLVSGQTPTALLNPVTIDQVRAQGSFFSLMQQVLAPVSIGWQYTNLSGQLLHKTADSRSVMEILISNRNFFFTLTAFFAGTYLLCLATLQKYTALGDVVNE